MRSSAPVAIDLFSGMGGLTRGLQQAGFRVAAGVEQHTPAADTYELNNPDATVFNENIADVSPSDIAEVLPGKLALLAACPPCQGFTSLTSKHRRDDPRNALASHITRFVRELRPAAVMLENVPRFATSKLGRQRFDALMLELERLGYKMSWSILQAADFGTAQFRRRLVMFGASKLIEPPTPTHSGDEGKLRPWRTVSDQIRGEDRPDVYEIGIERRTLADWHVIRKLTSINQARLTAARPGAPRWDLPNDLRPDCHKGSSEGFANVYGRMVWHTPSPTITGGCTSPSKGRYGHPSQARTISVMEAGLLQDFPKGYRIISDSIDDACEMVGNSFPARLAKAAAEQVAAVI